MSGRQNENFVIDHLDHESSSLSERFLVLGSLYAIIAGKCKKGNHGWLKKRFKSVQSCDTLFWPSAAGPQDF
ncbi:MAG: hypothetical protein II601_07705 [Lachnospiraceae bacterium]|nr:hypothetical protein [Lachnospiraceae bacterium]